MILRKSRVQLVNEKLLRVVNRFGPKRNLEGLNNDFIDVGVVIECLGCRSVIRAKWFIF